MTFFSGSSQVPIICEGGCTGCSCSAGLCLVSLTLSKADHTIPSTPTAGQEHDLFTWCLPRRLSSYSNLYFPGSISHSFYCWDYVIVAAFCMRRSEPGWMAVCKHPWSGVFHRLLGNQRVDSIMRVWQHKTLFYINVIVYKTENANNVLIDKAI